MAEGLPDDSYSNDDICLKKFRQRADIIKKLKELTLEKDPELRKILTHKLTMEISQMMRENLEMKEELIAFLRRLSR